VAQEPCSREEIEELRKIVARSLADANARGLSPDGVFGFGYNAARALATMVIRAAGYRVRTSVGGHYNTFLAFGVADDAFSNLADYLDLCRIKRNDFLYEQADVVTESEAQELLMKVRQLDLQVNAWIKKYHAALY